MNNNNSKFRDGFLLGAVLGGILVFALGTEKGRKLVKVITEEGMDGFDNVLREFEDYELAIEKPVGVVSTADLDDETPQKAEEVESRINNRKSQARRFFRSSKGKL